MPYIYVSQRVLEEIERRRAAVQTTHEMVIVCALEQTTPSSLARYYRERFYIVEDRDAHWILEQRARERSDDDT